MREIKFRGWCGYAKEPSWVYGALIEMPYNEEIAYIVTEGCRFFDDMTDGGVSIEAESDSCFKVRKYTVGQFTGLKDVEGNEIYEGDILARYDQPPLVRWLVLWCEDEARFGLRMREVPGFLDEDDQSFSKLRIHTLNLYVIGNIHDNPGLFKQEEKSDD